MDRTSITTVIGMLIVTSLARFFLGDSLGIIHYAFFGAIGGVLGYFINSLITRIFGAPKEEPKEQDHYYTDEEIETMKQTATTTTADVELTIENSETTLSKPYYYGFGGWLIFYTLCQIYTLYITAVGLKDWYSQIVSDDIQALRSEGYADFVDRFIILGLIGIVFSALIMIAIIITWVFGIKVSRYYKQSNIIYIAGNSISVIILLAYMYYLNYYFGETLFTFDDLSNIAIGAFMFAIIWIPYFLKSERVANTFTK